MAKIKPFNKMTPRQKQSYEWFVNTINKVNRQKKSLAEEYTQKKYRKRINSGEMITFSYPNPVTPLKQLKWFDAHPLDIILKVKGRHLLAINLHYLPTPLRELLLKKIIKINKSNISKMKRFELLYKEIRVFLIQHGILDLVVKKYIIGRIQGLTYIPYHAWKEAIHVPSEKFVFDGQYSMSDIHAMIKRSQSLTKKKGRR